MKLSLLYIILSLAVLGGVGTYFAGRKKNSAEQKKIWLKYFIYFLIIILLYGCICFTPKIFPWICGLIVIAGLIEIIRIQKMKPQKINLFS